MRLNDLVIVRVYEKTQSYHSGSFPNTIYETNIEFLNYSIVTKYKLKHPKWYYGNYIYDLQGFKLFEYKDSFNDLLVFKVWKPLSHIDFVKTCKVFDIEIDKKFYKKKNPRINEYDIIKIYDLLRCIKIYNCKKRLE